MIARPFAYLLTVAAIIAAPMQSPAIAADAPRPIEVHRIADESLIAFAAKFFYKRHPNAFNWSFKARYRSEENWTQVVREQTYSAEVNLSDQGAPALLLVVDNPNWCNSEGCLGTIFRKTATGYALICEAALPEPKSDAAKAQILPQIENGYRQIATATKIIEWNAQPDGSGLLCTTDDRKP